VKLAIGMLNGAMAGAAGTTALNAATYLDMVLRGRPSSTGPEDTAEKLAAKASVQIPGDDETRPNRVSGLGALNGIASGVLIGSALSMLRSAGWNAGAPATGLVATLAAMALTDGTMAVLGTTNPRTWSPSDWASDLGPHLAYGFITSAALQRMSNPASR